MDRREHGWEVGGRGARGRGDVDPTVDGLRDRKAWTDKKKLVGVRIHGLEDATGKRDPMGGNPFAKVSLTSGKTIAEYVALHDPVGANSKAVYDSINKNLKAWVDNAYKPA